ncbi:MAG: helicase-related protein [Candidatus Saccharibacteria bacterium]
MANATLPIAAFRNQIVATIAANSVTILVAETGAGKTTQLPQHLLDEVKNNYKLVVTQPRRLAALTVADRVAKEYDTPLGDVIGYRIGGNAEDDQQCSDATRCLFVTDGLALVRELTGSGEHTVLIVDEVHEWNLNIEVLVAWIKRQVENGSKTKFVLMSATLEAERLSEYFGGAPIIGVPGRTFEVEEQDPAGMTMEYQIATQLRQGRNALVFQPGKQEITNTIAALQRMGLDAEILPLHGELTKGEQSECFRDYRRPMCVVATDIAATSITIPGIDVVFDSGLKRELQIRDGVEGLYLVPISIAERTQRKGRAGRTKFGLYFDWCPTPYDDRPEFPTAEILRTRLEQTVLRLAEAGLDIEDLQFFHQPSLADIREAKRALFALGCMDERGRVTKIGHRASRMSVSVKYARMIIEAERLGVVGDVITVAAILEQGGIVARVCPGCKQHGIKVCRCWHEKMAPGETTSDLIAQLLVYRKCATMNSKQMGSSGVFVKDYHEAKRKREQLAKALKASVDTTSDFATPDKLQDILRAVCAGMVDHLYESLGGRRYLNGDGIQRELSHGSVVVPEITPQGTTQHWSVGVPFDLQINTVHGPGTLNLLTLVTLVDPKWLAEVAPHLSQVVTGANPRYDANLDDVVSTTTVQFNGQVISVHEALDPNHVNAQQLRRKGREDRQWREWHAWGERPEIMLPTEPDGTVTMPEIYELAYGADVETGESLLAYGTLAYNVGRWSTEPWFNTVWTRD